MVNVAKEIENVPARARLVGLEDTTTAEPRETQSRVKGLETHLCLQYKIAYISRLSEGICCKSRVKRCPHLKQPARGTHPAILVKIRKEWGA